MMQQWSWISQISWDTSSINLLNLPCVDVLTVNTGIPVCKWEWVFAQRYKAGQHRWGFEEWWKLTFFPHSPVSLCCCVTVILSYVTEWSALSLALSLSMNTLIHIHMGTHTYTSIIPAGTCKHMKTKWCRGATMLIWKSDFSHSMWLILLSGIDNELKRKLTVTSKLCDF